MDVKPGDIVEVTGRMNDPDPLPVGSRGVVRRIRYDQIDVKWDNGRQLMLLEQDPFEVVS